MKGLHRIILYVIANILLLIVGLGLETVWGNRSGYYIIGAFGMYSYQLLKEEVTEK